MGKRVLVAGTTILMAFGAFHAEDVAKPDLRALDGAVPEQPAKSRRGTPTLNWQSENAAVEAWWEGEFLHVALRSIPIHVAHLCVAIEDRVIVLHASSALGSVEYVKGDPEWSLRGAFDWQMRDTSTSRVAVAARQRYLDLESWVATTVEMGEPGQTEFVIAGRLVPPDAHMTAALMSAADPDSIVEMLDFATGCNDHGLVAGSPPDKLAFAPDAWPKVPRR